MKKWVQFVNKHGFTLFLLLVSVVGVNSYVSHKRTPGSMTVIESQGMDMTTMKPPGGSMPVSVESVGRRPLNPGFTYPAVVSAWSEEEVVARVPGKLLRLLVYPGDKVSAGQTLGILEAPEYEAELRKSGAVSDAKASEVISAERQLASRRSMLEAAMAGFKAAQIAKNSAEIGIEEVLLELERTRSELDSLRAEKITRQADLAFAEKDLARQESLYSKGFVAAAQVDSSRRDRDVAAARVQASEAAILSGSRTISITERRVAVAKQMVREAETRIVVAQAEVKQAQEGIAQAQADANTMRLESKAARAEVQGASSIADYRILASLSGGVVSERLVSPGTAVTVGQVILRLKSFGQVRVQAEIPQSASASIYLGLDALITGNGFTIPAKITSVFPSVDPQTRTFRVEARVQNESGILKPGMFARMEIGSPANRVLAIRSAALQGGDGERFVWTVQKDKSPGKSDWTCTMHPQVSKPGAGQCPICGMDLTLRQKGGALIAHRQKVTIIESGGDYTEIVSGLREGDQIIWAGFENLTEGMHVHVADADPGEAPKINTTPSQGTKDPKDEREVPVKAYFCPMHPEVQSDHPGTCPKCGMDLVKREAAGQ